jgi:hypothetical protein
MPPPYKNWVSAFRIVLAQNRARLYPSEGQELLIPTLGKGTIAESGQDDPISASLSDGTR